jgi:lysophospholipase L1-like esterase
MPASGVSGLDLYGRDDDRDGGGGGAWRYVDTLRPTAQRITARLAHDVAPGRRTYQVNLPLYNGVTSLEIGVPHAAAFDPVAPRKDRPVVFYGTSITQGGCASRPGMAFTHILGRRLDVPTINLGFSGNGRLEAEVGRFLAEIDAAAFVIDCVANSTVEEIAQRTVPLVRQLREKHGTADGPPILLLEARRSPALLPSRNRLLDRKHAAMRKAYDELRSAGVPNLHYRTGDDLIGHDDDGTVDGSHPTDLGMVRYADALEPELRKLLKH